MSYWEYQAGRRACLEAVANGDMTNWHEFSNKKPKTQEEKKKIMEIAKRELKKMEEEQ